MQRFRGGLVFKAHRLCVSLNSRLESNKEEEETCTKPIRVGTWTGETAPGMGFPGSVKVDLKSEIGRFGRFGKTAPAIASPRDPLCLVAWPISFHKLRRKDQIDQFQTSGLP